MAPMVRVRLTDVRRRSVRPELLRQRALKMLAALELPNAELSVVLCSDAFIQQLNRRYRRKNKPTDVLAFPMSGPGPSLPVDALLGDVIISLETARRQAVERSRPIVTEVTFLLAHGLLHLIGFDHQTDAQERRMSAKTDLLMAAAVRCG